MAAAQVYQNFYQVRIEQFEGPLALLLHLIRKEEMDIYDIPIHIITKQYMDYIQKMRDLDLEVAGEFVSMAATLIHIKSKMLLPQYDDDGEVVEEEDPRKELVQKLLEYQKYQEAGQKLYEKPLLGRDFWHRGIKEDVSTDEEGAIVIEHDNALFGLIGYYRHLVKNVKKKVHRVGMKGQSIAQRILELRDRLTSGARITLSELLGKNLLQENSEEQDFEKDKDDENNKLLITFLSLLELGKMGFVSLFQSEAYAEIYIDPKKEINRDIVSQVEEYDATEANDVVSALMSGEGKVEEEIEQVTVGENIDTTFDKQQEFSV